MNRKEALRVPDITDHTEQTVVRVDHATQGTRGRQTHVVKIVRPSEGLLAHDPTVIAGFASLARRVILQAFEDAAQGDGQARAFLTEHEDDGLLAHWIQQANLPVPVPTFQRTAAECLDDPERVQTLFARYRPHPVQSSAPSPFTTEEDSHDER